MRDVRKDRPNTALERFRVLFNQIDPRQLFFRVDIFRRRKTLRMVQTAGGNVNLIRPTVGLVGEGRAASVAESSKCAGVGFVIDAAYRLPI